MAFLLGSALIFGGLLGLHYRAAILAVVLPIAFVLPCGFALIVNTGTLNALGFAFLASAAVQLGFFAGGLAATEPDKRLTAPSFLHWRRRGV
jgi:hypothetical protein